MLDSLLKLDDYLSVKLNFHNTYHVWAYLFKRDVLKSTVEFIKPIVKETRLVYCEDKFIIKIIAKFAKSFT